MRRAKSLGCLLTVFATILSGSTLAAHHEDLQPVAKPGEVIVTYRGKCPSEAIDEAIALIKKTIAYERKNSPILYSSSPGVWSDGSIGAVDLHESEEAMEKAFAWQLTDEKWSTMYAEIASRCGLTVEDFEVNSLVAR
ncbi:MAG: hypothetical protein NZ743_08575 [Pseudomonadales bacterium]|nr:hypothetical protein [Pseudomonadales bacterium]